MESKMKEQSLGRNREDGLYRVDIPTPKADEVLVKLDYVWHLRFRYPLLRDRSHR
ncbi:MAG: hypothetical protein V8S96_07780 [Lachnospiraceae bacterium]